MLKMILAALMVFHGLAHAVLAMVPNPNDSQPTFANFFPGFGSWLFPGLSESAARTTASMLAALATIGSVAAGLALLGVVVPFDWWRVLAIGSAAVSLLLVVLFWDIYMIAGLLIDAAILATLVFTSWSPS